MMATRFIFLCTCTVTLFVFAHGHIVKRSDDVDPLESVVAHQGQLITQMQAELAAVKAEMAEKHKLVAFMVTVAGNQDLASHPHVKLGTPAVNLGGGIHTATHTFVAPVSGLYVFFMKVTGQAGPYMIVGLKKDGQVIAATETNDDNNNDRSSVQVLVQLKAGQSVWMERTGGPGHTIYGGGVFSTFGGFLLRAGESF